MSDAKLLVRFDSHKRGNVMLQTCTCANCYERRSCPLAALHGRQKQRERAKNAHKFQLKIVGRSAESERTISNSRRICFIYITCENLTSLNKGKLSDAEQRLGIMERDYLTGFFIRSGGDDGPDRSANGIHHQHENY